MANPYQLHLPPQASMMEMLEAIAPLPRDLVSDAYDAALEALAGQIPMQIHEYPSGSPCFTWVVPQKWSCEEAWLETLQGKRLLDHRDTPLHVSSYSQSFEGEVAREELLEHLEVHPHLPEGVPFSYSFFNNRWRLCCSRELRDSLKDDRYRVTIRTTQTPGSLKVGEVIVPGKQEAGFVLCAHVDHPGQANDGLSGVVVGLEVMRRLLAGPKPKHTIRFLIVCETFGSLAWLSNHEHLVPSLRAGMFLEMLGLEYPHALQYSQAKNTAWDRIAENVMREEDSGSWTGDFLKIVTNDDRQFNAPGIRVPMLSLSRVEEACGTGEGWPFTEYHSHLDNAARVSADSLERSADLTMKILRAWDEQIVPAPNYRCEPCLSAFGVKFDFAEDPGMATILFEMIHAIDGKTPLSEIAAQTGRSEAQLLPVLQALAKAGVINLPE